MNPQDLEFCKTLHSIVAGPRYQKQNYLFLQPFEISQTPGYLDVVPKLMDLGTCRALLDANATYTTRQEFLKDLLMTFENAVAYHSGKKATKWLAKVGKDMIKIVNKERKILEGGRGAASGGVKQKTLLPTKKNKSKLLSGQGKLKLKLSPSKAAVAATSDNKPKLTLKVSQPPATASTGPTAASLPSDPPKAKKPRLTLKLGGPKGGAKSSDAKPKATGTPATKPTAASKTQPKKKPTVTAAPAASASRGKELPKGVVPPPTKPKATNAKKSTNKKGNTTTTSKTKISLKSTASASSSAVAGSSSGGSRTLMTPARKAQCAKVLAGLRRRQYKTIGWFLHPITDKAIVADYKNKIPKPMDLFTMQHKLDKSCLPNDSGGNSNNSYKTLQAFCLDLRRIFANCLRYNTSNVKDSLRPVAVTGLECAEQLLTVFLAKPEQHIKTVVVPPLLFCWKLCLSVLDTLYNMTNPKDGQVTAWYFLYPVSFYCGGSYPPDYLERVKQPMDFGTVTAKLIEGLYINVDQFQKDCYLVLENCQTYYGGVAQDGKFFTDQAARLKGVLKQQLDALNRYSKSSLGETAKKNYILTASTARLPRPTGSLLLSIVEELKALKYTDKATKITEAAMGPFEKAVSLVSFPDYHKFISTPMDLSTIQQRVKSGVYVTPEDFEYDVLLMFQNCITYNSVRKTEHLIAIAKYGQKHFKKVFASKLRQLDDPLATPKASPPSSTSSKRPAEDSFGPPGSNKKMKVDHTGGVNRGKSAPRVLLSTSQGSAVAASANAARNRPPPIKAKTTVPKFKPNQPVPLHIAIAQVKEHFPLRRAVKTLQNWEAACARYFKEMMRHPWISAARPKFIFHVPVPVLFPELREAYSTKVKKPMDLTTVECTLLAGNRYRAPEDFISDLGLVFTNAIKFNKDGRDVGDPLSCAYYDASVHLLRYSRWLSLELFTDYIEESDHMDVSHTPGMPPITWKLTSANRSQARKEMEVVVMKEPIDRSLEGDRYTWMEAECEKLLKALRHQSDFKKMQFFIQPNYPADYTAFITKPMDWEKVQRTLKKRGYETFRHIIEDLRLIFSNALKYNARHAGTETVSGAAYDAAKYMSGKLEAAIQKLIVATSDRIERERIDHRNAEREISAAERAEDARVRAQWKSDNPGSEGGPPPARLETVTSRIRPTGRVALRRENSDFEVPFFDEGTTGQHEHSYLELVRQQKATYERQRQHRKQLQKTCVSLGSAVYLRMMHRDMAVQWSDTEQTKQTTTPASTTATDAATASAKSQQQEEAQASSKLGGVPKADSVLKTLENEKRTKFEMKVSIGKALKMNKSKKAPKRVLKPALFEFGDEDDE